MSDEELDTTVELGQLSQHLATLRQVARMGNHAAAIEAAERLLQAVPAADGTAALQLRYSIGVWLGQTGDHDAAAEVGRRLMETHPASSQGPFLVGTALQSTGKNADALPLLESALRLSKGAASAVIREALSNARAAAKKTERSTAVADHCRTFNVFSPLRCPRCEESFSGVTPQWCCPRCFSKDHTCVHTWQPDAAAVCSVCHGAIARLSRHHCRLCARLVCGGCSGKQRPVPLLGLSAPARVCDRCDGICQRQSATPGTPTGTPTAP